jgi:hypothetical protein
LGGRGIHIQLACINGACDPTTRATAVVSRSLLADNHDLGLSVSGSEAAIEGAVVRRTQPRQDQSFGRGINVEPCGVADGCTPTVRASATVEASVVEDNHETGFAIFGADARIDTTIVRGTLPHPALGTFGYGIVVSLPCSPQLGCDGSVYTNAVVTGSLVENNREMGVALFGADATVDTTFVRNTLAREADNRFGDGISVSAHSAPANAGVHFTLIADSARAGISNFGGLAAIAGSTIRCAAFDLEGEEYNGHAFAFDDGGGNTCGCPTADQPCLAVTASIEPPEPLAPTE